jgi:hypothetical protein
MCCGGCVVWARVRCGLRRESSGVCELAAERARARGDDVRPDRGAGGGFEIDGCSEGEFAGDLGHRATGTTPWWWWWW